MKPITQEWVRKAEADFVTAERELAATTNQNYDAVCFHSQQCVEKYLKGRLHEAELAFEKTHDLSWLLNLVLSVEPDWEILRADLNLLSSFAVDYRYPGESADILDAQRAMDACKEARRLVRESLGLT